MICLRGQSLGHQLGSKVMRLEGQSLELKHQYFQCFMVLNKYNKRKRIWTISFEDFKHQE